MGQPACSRASNKEQFNSFWNNKVLGFSSKCPPGCVLLLRHLRPSLTPHYYTFQMWATLGREMATQVIYSKHLSSFRPEWALKTLGSKPCQWQTKKNRQTGYYRFKATGNLWKPLETAGVSKCTEWVFHGAFHQNNVAQVCSCSSTLAQRSVMTSRVCHADIIPRLREAQKNNNKQQYGPVEIRCT